MCDACRLLQSVPPSGSQQSPIRVACSFVVTVILLPARSLPGIVVFDRFPLACSGGWCTGARAREDPRIRTCRANLGSSKRPDWAARPSLQSFARVYGREESRSPRCPRRSSFSRARSSGDARTCMLQQNDATSAPVEVRCITLFWGDEYRVITRC
jgi:hypothetical protein